MLQRKQGQTAESLQTKCRELPHNHHNTEEVVPKHTSGMTTIYISQDLQPAHLCCAVLHFAPQLRCQCISKSFEKPQIGAAADVVPGVQREGQRRSLLFFDAPTAGLMGITGTKQYSV